MSASGGNHQSGHMPGGNSRERGGVNHPKQVVVNGSLHNSHVGGHLHPIMHHGDIDPHGPQRVAMAGGNLIQPQLPPPPKMDPLAMIDPWSRLSQPQVPQSPGQFTHPQAHSPLDQAFMNQSAAAYYHAPMSPYGAPYGALGNEATHGGAGWSNGGDVASFFGFPAPTGDFHSESMSLNGMFGNGYPPNAYGATGPFGYPAHQFSNTSHPTPGAPNQDFSSWAGPMPGNAPSPHEMLERNPQVHPHQKAMYSDYYRYEIMGSVPTSQLRQPLTAQMGMNGNILPNGTLNQLKNLENQMATLSMVPQGMPPSLPTAADCGGLSNAETSPIEVLPQQALVRSANERHKNGSVRNTSVQDTENRTKDSSNQIIDDQRDKIEDQVAEESKTESSPDEANNNEARDIGTRPNEAAGCKASGDVKVDPSESQVEPSSTIAWDWTEEEVKDWSASPPPEEIVRPAPSSSTETLSLDEASTEAQKHPLLADLIRENNYNPETFDIDVVNARFFVIKSYSEDDVHRSIKYSIWCSTERGNVKLDQAYRNQQSSTKGPIYLFYSVNGSGHFCGMSQMTSSVDYQTSTGVWAQDKWKGQFRVKWVYVKDIPNKELRHIRLENNEGKPVTNSRDTQEIPYDKGRLVLEKFHHFRHRSNLFDDFVYYEEMEEALENEKDHHQQQGSRYHQGNAEQSPSSRSGRCSGGGSSSGTDREYRNHRRDTTSPHANVPNHRDSPRDNHREVFHRPNMREMRSGGNGTTGNGARQPSNFKRPHQNRNGWNDYQPNRDRNADSADFSNFRRNNYRGSDSDRQDTHRDTRDRRPSDHGDRNFRRS